MKTTMYNKSKVQYENTLHNLDMAHNSPEIEDSYFDTACYNAQQTIEFILKAVLLENQITFNKKTGHDILYLLNLVTENTDFTFDKQDDLKKLSTTITSWEEKGRYYSGIRTKEDTIRRVLNIYKSIDQSFVDRYLDGVPKGYKDDDCPSFP